MRPTAALLAVTLAAVGRADPPSVGVVVADGLVARAAPKADAPDTQPLPRNTVLVVSHAEGDGWLAVQPPPGAMSWINHLFLADVDDAKPFPQNGTVNSEGEVKLAAGKVGVPRPLDVRKARVPDGTIVTVLGPKVRGDADNTQWYPIAAPADDFRYVPAAGVQVGGPSRGGFDVRSPTALASAAKAPEPAAKPTGPGHPLWAEAEREEQAGRFDKAEELYFKLAKESNAAGGDADLANLCYTRIHALREKKRTGGTPAPGTGVRWAASNEKPAARDDRRSADPDPKAAAAKAYWSGAATLRESFRAGGRQYYELADARGKPIVYALPGTGAIDLSRYKNRTVDLYGTVSHPDGLEGVGLMAVTRIDAGK